QRPTAGEHIAQRAEVVADIERRTREIVEREAGVEAEGRVLADATEVPSQSGKGLGLIESKCLEWPDVAQDEVGVEVDVVRRLHPAQVIDLESGGTRQELDPPEGQWPCVLVVTKRYGVAAERGASWIEPDVILVGTLKVVCAGPLQPREGGRVALHM